MAKQKGIIPLTGTIGGINFYYLNGKPIARRAGGGFNGKAIKEKASMQRVRENGSEFGHCSRVNKAFRLGLRPFYAGHTFTHFHSRLMKLFTRLKDLDTVNERGKRRVGTGMATDTGKRVLRSFLFTPACPLSTVLPFTYTYDSTAHTLVIPQVASSEINWVAGSDCISLTLGVLVFDFEDLTYRLFESSPHFIEADGAKQSVTLSPTQAVSGTGMEIAFLGIRFYQFVNGERYVLASDDAVGFEIVGLE
ncbi:hypothetical protein [Marixanthomonas spongiae]|nr:hypothetical protein [Marixanthomonas spongiae]